MSSSPRIPPSHAAYYYTVFAIGQVAVIAVLALALFVILHQSPRAEAEWLWHDALKAYNTAQEMPENKREHYYERAHKASIKALETWPHDSALWFRFANMDAKINQNLGPAALKALGISAILRPELAEKIEAHKVYLRHKYEREMPAQKSVDDKTKEQKTP